MALYAIHIHISYHGSLILKRKQCSRIDKILYLGVSLATRLVKVSNKVPRSFRLKNK